MNKQAQHKIMAARTALVLDEPFWGQLSSRLIVKEDPSCATAWTDGRTFGYNPTFVLSLTSAKMVGLTAHETGHCALGHPWRRGGRKPRQWNVACDLSLNDDLRRAGFTLPDGALFPEQFSLPLGKSAEWYYDRVPADAEKGGGDDDADDDAQGEYETPNVGEQPTDDPQDAGAEAVPMPVGEVRDAPTASPVDEAAPPTESEWQQAVMQAATVSGGRGTLPGGVQRIVASVGRSRVNWRAILQRFAQEVARDDYSWVRPNRHYAPRGIYLPALRSEQTGVIALGIDVSGSIDQVLLGKFQDEVRAVVQQIRPRAVRVLYCDTAVTREEEFGPDDQVTLSAPGGGGTDFRPVFDAIAHWDEAPCCVVYLTDLEGTFPEHDPGIPTLWVTGNVTTQRPPFGALVVAE